MALHQNDKAPYAGVFFSGDKFRDFKSQLVICRYDVAHPKPIECPPVIKNNPMPWLMAGIIAGLVGALIMEQR